MFSFEYFSRNVYHAFVKFPTWQGGEVPLQFDGMGTAFWVNNLLFVCSLLGCLLWKGEYRLRRVAALTIGVTWFFLLLHESNGSFQIGYRYVIDLFVFTWLGLAYLPLRVRQWIPAIVLFSIILNLYGIHWFQVALG
jgi:hypothetical protein